MPITIGADPELFLMKKDAFISGHTFPCGTKKQPRKTKHGFVQCDGIALEMNIPPAKTKKEFCNGIHGTLADLRKIVYDTDPDCILVAVPVAPVTPEFLSKLPPEAKDLGCDPDYNAYTLDPNPRPRIQTPLRTAAGHIHIGWTKDVTPGNEEHFIACAALARQLDFFIGLPSLVYDKDNLRRSLYGKAGAFRPKHYGMEYRVPSNVWLSSNKLIECTYNAAWLGADMFFDGHVLHEKYGDFAQDAINTNDSKWHLRAPDLGRLNETYA